MHFSSFQKQNKQSKKTGRSWPRGCNKNTHTVCNIFLGVAPLPVTVGNEVGNEGLGLDFCTGKMGHSPHQLVIAGFLPHQQYQVGG